MMNMQVPIFAKRKTIVMGEEYVATESGIVIVYFGRDPDSDRPMYRLYSPERKVTDLPDSELKSLFLRYYTNTNWEGESYVSSRTEEGQAIYLLPKQQADSSRRVEFLKAIAKAIADKI